MKKRILAFLLSSALMISFAGCGGAAEPSAQPSQASSTGSSSASSAALEGKLTLNGSTSMAPVCQALGDAFTEKNPDVTMEQGGTGSGDAVPAVNGGTALIGNLSRELKDSENPSDFEVVTIALDGIAVVVNGESKVADLTKDQIASIFSGEITDWSEVGGDAGAIKVVGREASSGTRDGFESIFGIKEKTKYGVEVSETGVVLSTVASDKNAIGYVSLASVDESKGIKALKVDGIEATEPNVADGSYFVQRPFVQIYKKGSSDPLVKAWFEFLGSDEGQKIIEDAGLVPQTIA